MKTQILFNTDSLCFQEENGEPTNLNGIKNIVEGISLGKLKIVKNEIIQRLNSSFYHSIDYYVVENE